MDPSRGPIDIDDPATGPQSAPATSDAEPSEGSEPAGDIEPREAGSPGAVGEHPRTEPCATPDDAEPASFDPADTLSPAVRRLVRQYDLDITGIHGTGPAGKIRVGDVIGMLGGRTDASGARASDPTRGTATSGEPDTGRDAGVIGGFRESRAEDDPSRTATAGTQNFRAAEGARAVPTTTLFDCDLTRVLSHRKRERRNETEIALTSYFLAACADALRTVPEIAVPQHGGAPRLGVLLAGADGGTRRTLVVAATELDDGLRMVDGQLRGSADDDLTGAQLLVHHYGPSGSLLATPTEIGIDHAASVGVGRVRREIVVKAVDGEEAPRVAARCYVTLTFRPELVTLARANQFVATLVRVLEQWPAEPTSA
jgi:pyruvate/2-oxoglutarate dehydrogenase complex dihydrolipoamide acyltransferase (E2) component